MSLFPAVSVLAVALAGCSRVEPQASAVPPQAVPFEFVSQWGVRGPAPGQLDDPVGPALDGFGRVYFVNRGSASVQKFEPNGAPLLSFDAEAVRHATSVAVDSGGGIYVANAANGEVRIFFPEGDFLRTFLIAPQRKLEGPFVFDIAENGTVVAPDPGGGRVQEFSGQGKLERTWKVAPAPGHTVSKPVVAVAGPDGFVYVGDAEGTRVVKFAADGMQVASWDDSADGPAALLGLGVTSNAVYMLRGASPRIVVWTLDGQRSLSDNLGGRLDGMPPNAGSMVVSPAGDLIVFDPSVPRVLRFRIHLGPPENSH